MDDLVQFLRDRYDDDEQEASAASPGPWHVDAEADEVLAVDDIVVAEGFALSGRQLRATTRHIARHDPARVLREVDAKRRAVDHYEDVRRHAPGHMAYILAEGAVGKQIKLMALPYADHPDYQDDWRP